MGNKVVKIIDKMRRQPNSISPDDAEKVLLELGFEPRPPRGSHKRFKRKSDGRWFTLVISKNPIKKYLVDGILDVVDES
ncbi:MAG: type II toxin-antitoxin system HicA family toxin [Anaerococcus sp.]|nr:type II toxin-antitoxin system HicA family toxin [Anaerococcus sp.]